MARIVGIDLGTTHTVVAWCDGDGEPELFALDQLVAHGQSAERALLSSCLYAPLDDEVTDARWLVGDTSRWIAGEHARARGREVSQRHVASAKSWLSYGKVDRRAAILPWRLAGDPEEGEGDSGAPRISPVTASALLLQHVERVWGARHPRAPLAEQQIVLTVPASFDAVARELTVEAARAVGLSVRLLEEPQAAFYDFMRLGGDAALEGVLAGDEGRVLICDVGGGTTDLSLVKVTKSESGVDVERIAVGRHLLLGGDNMDLALAHLCEQRLGGERLDERRFAQLVAACRDAKEQLLSPGAPDALPIVVLQRGSKLVGGALETSLSRSEVERVVCDGFFPDVALDDTAPAAPRAGMVAFGLPYERDVAITRHVAAFVRAHGQNPPSALLLNGGVFRAASIAQRVSETVLRWGGGRTKQLTLTDPDTSVALGAVSYGLSLRGRVRRIRGGASKSYYLGLDGAARQAVCVLPKGSDESTRMRVDTPGLALAVGRRVRFDLYASDDYDPLGALLAIGAGHERLAPLLTELRTEGAAGTTSVALEAELSAIGTLELSCVETEPRDGKAHRFRLAFDLSSHDAPSGHEGASAAARYGKRLDEARALLARIYSKRTRKDVTASEVKGSVRALEKIFGKRSEWDATLLRTLYDELWTFQRGRKTSVDHERVFWRLAGHCLRPGAGHARDDERVRALVGQVTERLAHPQETRSWQQLWIALRRVAAGIDEAGQVQLRDLIDPFVAPAEKGLKPLKPWKNDARWEMVELCACLERVPAERRGELGGWMIEHTFTERDARLWAALGRIGARAPIYASVHHAVAARTVERWMDHLLRERWDQIASAPRAAVAMCRVTGDRARDVSENTRNEVATRLEKLGVDAARILPVREWVALDDRDRADFYGDDLPAGLALR